MKLSNIMGIFSHNPDRGLAREIRRVAQEDLRRNLLDEVGVVQEERKIRDIVGYTIYGRSRLHPVYSIAGMPEKIKSEIIHRVCTGRPVPASTVIDVIEEVIVKAEGDPLLVMQAGQLQGVEQ